MMRRHDRVLAVLWPAFLMAGVMEMLVFAVIDPAQLHLPGGHAMAWSANAVYTVAFFVFWALIATAGAITVLLGLGSGELNRPSTR